MLKADCKLNMIFVYSDQYDLNLGTHVFPTAKYKLTKQRLLEEGVAKPGEILEPEPATDEDVALVHDRDYIWKLKNGKLSQAEILRMEVPYSPELVRAVWLSAGGSILAGQKALEEGAAANIGGGFHHAFPGHGEGFCVLHDVAIAIRSLQKDNLVDRAMTVDLDVHQGNGTAAIFAGDETVFTFSMHQQNNYPVPKPPSSLDVNLSDGIRDQEYLDLLRESLDDIIPKFRPQVIFYVAGADPYWDDQLGGLRLSLDGLKKRDRMVFEKAKLHGVPVAVTLAGGYARNVEDTVRIHTNTLTIAKEFAK
jgi:acetoin utilization deacetylase AcuC-like enzyme